MSSAMGPGWAWAGFNPKRATGFCFTADGQKFGLTVLCSQADATGDNLFDHIGTHLVADTTSALAHQSPGCAGPQENRRAL